MSAIPKPSHGSSGAPLRRGSSATPAATKAIGVVLAELAEEFPDVTVSKIRYLESEGLVTPQRTASGYRRFTAEDIDRLRYILIAQRDKFLPLKVIREQLEAMDSGQVTALVKNSHGRTLVTPENFRAAGAARLTDTEVADQAGVAPEAVADFVQWKVIEPDSAGFFTPDDVTAVANASGLRALGFGAQQFRSLRTAAQRQADAIAQLAGVVAHEADDSAHQRAADLGRQMSALSVSLHATVMKNALRRELEQ